ncbi:MAG: MazG-like family protein, partial [Bradymonadaceae bacterium]
MDAQDRVAAFVATHDLAAEPAYRALDLVSEVGEVAKEVNLSTGYGETPDVDIDGQLYETSVVESTCTPVPDTRRTVRECTQVTFELPEGELNAGDYKVSLHNPDPVGCESNEVDLYVKPEPIVADVRPSPICTEGESYTGVTVEGEHFFEVDGTLPEVEFGGTTAGITVQDVNDCQSTSGTNTRECKQLLVDVNQGALNEGQITENKVVVTNPQPVDCTSDDPVFETDVPSPVVDSTDNDALPDAVVQRTCPNSTKEQSLVVEGDYYLDIDGDTPDVTVDANGTNHTYTDAVLAGSCQTLTNVSKPTKKCDVLRVELTRHPNMAGGQHEVGIFNPRTA